MKKSLGFIGLLSINVFLPFFSGWAAPVYERPIGAFASCALSLKADPDEFQVFLSLRDGRAKALAVKDVRHPFLSSNITLNNGVLNGIVQDDHPVHGPGLKLKWHIEARLDDEGRFTGTFQGDFSKSNWNAWSAKLEKKDVVSVEGSVTGRLNKRENGFPPGADWPQWEGPFGNSIAQETGAQLIDDLRKARLVWKSESATPAAPGPSKDIPRTMGNAPFLPYCGGGATPVIGENKVFLRYTLPSGKAYDKKLYQVYVQAGLPEAALARGRRLLSVAADDVVVCFDAATGRLLWRTTFPDAGLNFQGHKIAQNNLSALYHAGRVFAVGSTLRFYALDAKTGKALWERSLGARHEEMEKAKALAVKEGRFLGGAYGNRSWGFVPVACAGLIVCNDKAGNLAAFDPSTGDRKWVAEKCAANNATPLVWKHGDQERLIVANRTHVFGLNGATGEKIWQLEKMAGRSALTVSDGLLAFRDETEYVQKKDEAKLMCSVYRLLEKGPALLWRKPWKFPEEKGGMTKDQYSDYVRPMMHRGTLYLSGRMWTDCYDALTGKHLARVEGEGGVANAGHLMLAHGRLFLNRDGKHGASQLAMYTTDAEDFKKLGEPEIWSPPHPNTTSYGPYLRFPIVDGRMFMRGNDAIYCYDLRK